MGLGWRLGEDMGIAAGSSLERHSMLAKSVKLLVDSIQR